MADDLNTQVTEVNTPVTEPAGSGNTQPTVSDADIQSLMAKYNNDPKAIARVLYDMNKSHGRATAELGNLRKLGKQIGGEPEPEPAKSVNPDTVRLNEIVEIVTYNAARGKMNERIDTLKTDDPHYSIVANDFEKILRSDPTIQRMYVELTKAKPGDVQDRATELIDHAYNMAMTRSRDKIGAAYSEGKIPYVESSSARGGDMRGDASGNPFKEIFNLAIKGQGPGI